MGATGGRRAHRVDVVATVAAMHRVAHGGLVAGQILPCHQAVVTLHLGGDQLGGLTLVELTGALFGDALQGGGQVRLAVDVADLVARAILLEELGAAGLPGLEAFAGAVDAVDEALGHGEALFGKLDGRGQGRGQAHGAVALQRQCQPCHGAGYAGGVVGVAGQLGHSVAVVVLEHGLVGRLWGLLAVVDGDDFIAVLVGDQHEAAAADIARTRLGDRQRKACGDGGVHGIAAVGQHLSGHLGGQEVAGSDHAAGADLRMEAFAFQDRLTVGQRRGRDETQSEP